LLILNLVIANCNSVAVTTIGRVIEVMPKTPILPKPIGHYLQLIKF